MLSEKSPDEELDENSQKRPQKIAGNAYILFFIHRSQNVDGPKLLGGGIDKSYNWNCKTNHYVSKLQHNTSRCNNRIHKKRNYYPHILRCILHIRTVVTKQIRRIFFPRTKIQHTNSRYAPLECIIACRMRHHYKCNGISHRSRTGRFI